MLAKDSHYTVYNRIEDSVTLLACIMEAIQIKGINR